MSQVTSRPSARGPSTVSTRSRARADGSASRRCNGALVTRAMSTRSSSSSASSLPASRTSARKRWASGARSPARSGASRMRAKPSIARSGARRSWASAVARASSSRSAAAARSRSASVDDGSDGGGSGAMEDPKGLPCDGVPETRRSIVVVEDHPTVREGLCLVLEREGFAVVGRAGTAEEGHGAILEAEPGVALIDVSLPDGTGVDLTRRLLRRDRRLGVLLYTGMEDVDTLEDALASGARGLTLKTSDPATTLHAVRSVAAGGAVLDPGGPPRPQGPPAPRG